MATSILHLLVMNGQVSVTRYYAGYDGADLGVEEGVLVTLLLFLHFPTKIQIHAVLMIDNALH